MVATTTNRDGSEVKERFHKIIADITNELLNAYYTAHPSSSGFGADYEAPQGTPDGTYYVGRENGADGAKDEVGFDYFYRRFRDPESWRNENEYVHGKYGWMDINGLIEESNLIRQVFEEGVENDYLSESALERYDTATENLRNGIREVREQYDLSDIADLMRSHEIDTLRTLLGHGDEESRTVWQLLFSKDEDGEHVENPLEIPAISEVDRLMFVRTERYYYDEDERDGKWYDYGAVIGYDDTPERFFVHRLSSDPDLRDDDTEWTIELVKEKMGFDVNLHEVGDDMPLERRVRVQGDLAVIRRDYDDALDGLTKQKFDSRRDELGHEHIEEFIEEHPTYAKTEGVQVSRRRVNFHIDKNSTDLLKELQDELGIDEEAVRKEQEQRDISRLSAKRRNEIITYLCEERAYKWCIDREGADEAQMWTDAKDAARGDFEETEKQVNEVIGNHTLMASSTREHPNRRFGDDATREALVVPETATVFVIHDEHNDKNLTLGPGVYEWGFLQGYEDEWWMSN